MTSSLLDSVVYISSNSSQKGNGTGFVFYNDEAGIYIMTCAHVVAAVGGEGNILVNNLQADLVVSGSEQDIDLAVLRVGELPEKLPLPLGYIDDKDSTCIVPGFYIPQGSKEIEYKPLTSKLTKQGAAGKSVSSFFTTFYLTITDGDQLEPGYSGSPVIDSETGFVVGVMSIMYKSQTTTKQGRATSIEALKAIWPQVPLSLFNEKQLGSIKDNNISTPEKNLISPLPAFDPQLLENLDTAGGAVPLDSQFYIERWADTEAKKHLLKNGVTIRIKGSRQVGKTSLLARLIKRALDNGYTFIYIDFQELENYHFEKLDTLLYYIANRIANELQTNQSPDDYWQQLNRFGPKDKLSKFLSREVLKNLALPFILFFDEVDRVFSSEHFRDDFFSLIRSWHNNRAMPHLPEWKNLNIVLAYSTEASLFIADFNTSPFNVGTECGLSDFDRSQVEQLNQKHGSPVKTETEMDSIMQLLQGHPFLVRKAMYVLAMQNLTVADLLKNAGDDDGPFGEHLRHYLAQFNNNAELSNAMKSVIINHICPNDALFYQLRSGGLVVGSSRTKVQPRCGLYEYYFQRHL